MQMAEPMTTFRDEVLEELRREMPPANLKHTAALKGAIFKVPSYMRRNKDESAYTPELISIGPYHALHPTGPYIQRDQIRKQMQDIKWYYLRDLIHDRLQNNGTFLEECLNIIRNRKNDILNKYDPPIHIIDDSRREIINAVQDVGKVGEDILDMTTKQFEKMMVLDGCFIVELMLKWKYEPEKQENLVKAKSREVRVDLLRIENQIPFFLIEEFCKVVYACADYKGPKFPFRKLCVGYLSDDSYVPYSLRRLNLIDYNSSCIIDHLLHLYQSRCLHPDYIELHHGRTTSSLWHHCGDWVGKFSLGLRYCWKQLQLLLSSNRQETQRLERCRRDSCISGSIPNAVYLRDTGFKFEKKHPLSKFSYIDYTNWGTIQIPALSPDLIPFNLMKNLVAFEQCRKLSSDELKPFSAFARFMHYLLTTPDDVALLRECDIIDKRFGNSNANVVWFFRNLCLYISSDQHDSHLDLPVVNHLRAYYTEKDYMVRFYMWRKKLIPDYFNNPWAVPSMIAALVALALTAVSTFYTVYAYYRPRLSN